jgi:4-hydroxyphenylacetate 3-monooxygenase
MTAGLRTGAQYRAALEDGRCVFVDGERVGGLAGHPAFAGVVSTAAELFDYAADPANGMIVTAPETGRPANAAFLIPRTPRSLEARAKAITRWARLGNGFMTRTPDHVAGILAGLASAADVFEAAWPGAGENVLRFYRRVLDENLFVTMVVIPPQVGRLEPRDQRDDEFVQVGIAAQRPDGLVLRGAQMLGTAAVISDYLFVSSLKPLRPGDEKYAISLVVPVSAPGLKLSCRRPYAASSPSEFDYPLSTRFDESDALAVFDDVFVPWPDIFAYHDVRVVTGQWHGTAAGVLGASQAHLRLATKLGFILGVAQKVAKLNDLDRLPVVEEKLGRLASLAAVFEGLGVAARAEPELDENLVLRPNARFTYAAMALVPDLYAECLHLLRELLGTSVLQVPASYRDLVAEQTRDLITGYVGSAGDPRSERVKLLKLAWDIVGSEFAGRHYQYEMFQGGAPFVARRDSHRHYGVGEPTAMVEKFLAGYGLPGASAPAAPAPHREGAGT